MEQPFLQALQAETPLQIVGTPYAYSALLAQKAGFKAIYLSGAGLANGDYGLPDLGLTDLSEVVNKVQQITQACDLPLLVDADTGWGSPLNVQRTFYQLSKAGASGAHIEDQDINKRCGHRDKKRLVSKKNMIGRIQAALDGRAHDHFLVMARTDALANEGLEASLDRALSYQEAGAQAIFVEAVKSLEHYQAFTHALNIPVLANLTEFGKTPLFALEELKQVGVQMVLYPLSAFRAMNQAAFRVFETIRKEGNQIKQLEKMQSRVDLYDVLNYQQLETQLDHYLESMEMDE